MNVLIPLLLGFMTLGYASSEEGGATQEEVTVFLVRHAERADDPGPDPEDAAASSMVMMAGDPPLSEAGRIRASTLARTLRDAGITHVHTTDYRRTWETARPLAEVQGVEMAVYDPSHLQAFAARLSRTPGRHLVVGHSDTTPALVEALGGEGGPAIQPLEYDRLYVVFPGVSGARTLLLRYGEPFPPE